jgi:hypothetical protein
MAKEFNENMVNTMKNNGAKKVFINDAGQWLFHETKGFTEYSREEVLGGEVSETKPLNKLNLAELKAVAIEKEIAFSDDVKKADLLNLILDFNNA